MQKHKRQNTNIRTGSNYAESLGHVLFSFQKSMETTEIAMGVLFDVRGLFKTLKVDRNSLGGPPTQ